MKPQTDFVLVRGPRSHNDNPIGINVSIQRNNGKFDFSDYSEFMQADGFYFTEEVKCTDSLESLTYGTPIPYRYCSDSSSNRAKKRDRATRALSQTPHPAEPQGGSENLILMPLQPTE
jgi:hypothetical protein